MRILATADLHYNVRRGVAPTRRLAAEIVAAAPDALLLVGDCAANDLDILEQCLHLFDRLRAPKFYVPGNHELWVGRHGDSLRRYEHELPAAAGRCGFDCLDAGPRLVGDVGFVGSIGWYDYAFADPVIEVPARFYQAKVGPGAAGQFAEHRGLLGDDLSDRARGVIARWMDGVHVRLGVDDAAFLDRLLDRLDAHLREVSVRAERIVVATHHLPFAELLPRNCAEPPPNHRTLGGSDNWSFADAYMGSPRIGELIRRFDKVRWALSAHSHWPARATVNGIDAINIGSGYHQKRFVTIEV